MEFHIILNNIWYLLYTSFWGYDVYICAPLGCFVYTGKCLCYHCVRVVLLPFSILL